MENASKALLIAGAVLIAILLISVGIMIYSGSSGIFKKGGVALSDAEISAFNSEFKAYEGRISGSQVKSLVNLINSNNSNKDKLSITVLGTAAGLSSTAITDGASIPSPQGKGAKGNAFVCKNYTYTSILDLKKFDVTMADGNGDGLIDWIAID